MSTSHPPPSAELGSEVADNVANFARERAAAQFDVLELKHFLNGSTTMTEAKEQVMAQLEADPTLCLDGWYDMRPSDHRRRTMEIIRVAFRAFIRDHGDPVMRAARLEMFALHSPDWLTRNGVHFGLFIGAITSQGTQEQQDLWVPRALALRLFGCFAMTELRGGSNLRALETTATFYVGGAGAGAHGMEGPGVIGPDNAVNPGDAYFEVHSPSITSLKWWIGGAAETSTHATVYARLITPDGAEHGVHVFIVQLRHLETHTHVAGVRTGDVGAKMGRNGIDNGWISFNHVRIPVTSHLRKYAHVEPDGTFVRTKGSKPQMAYGALIMGRSSMVADSASALQLATTIAVRWAVARRQGQPIKKSERAAISASAAPPAALSVAGAGKKKGSAGAAVGGEGGLLLGRAAPQAQLRQAAPALEPQLLDYTTHQAKLLPLVANAFAFAFAAQRMREMLEKLMDGIESDDISALPDVHATSAGLKAFCTWTAHYGIDTCRHSMGGHGYSAYSRLPRLFSDFAVQCTWEGDNTVMALQTARYLISSLARVRAPPPPPSSSSASPAVATEPLSGSVRYLTDRRIPATCGASSPSGITDTNTLLMAMRWRARASVLGCADALAACTGKKRMSEGEAWNACAVQLVDASRAHVMLNIASFFAVAVARRRADEAAVLGLAYPGGPTIDPLTGKPVPIPPLKSGAPPPPSAARGSGTRTAAAVPAESSSGTRKGGPAAAAARSRLMGVALRMGSGVQQLPAESGGANTAHHRDEPSPISQDILSSLAYKPAARAVPVTGPLYPILKSLCDLFMLSTISADAAFYLRGGHMTAKQVDWIDAALASCLASLRPSALPLVDSFGLSDFMVGSPLGRKDGDVYSAYIRTVRADAAKAGAEGRGATAEGAAPYFTEMLVPMLEGEDIAAAFGGEALNIP